MMLIQKIESFFAAAAAWGTGLPQYILVPLIMLLATVGTILAVGLLAGLIRLIFGQKAIDFIKNIPQHLSSASNSFNGMKNE